MRLILRIIQVVLVIRAGARVFNPLSLLFWSVNNFIPNLWSGSVLVNLYKAQVFTQTGVVNRQYEGQIRRMGDSVKITAIGPVTMKSYSRNTDMAAPDQLTDAASTLTIGQAKYFNFAIDDLDQAQSDPELMSGATREAAYAMSNDEDGYVAGLYTDFANLIGTSGSPKADLATAGKPYEYLATLKQLLDEANVPQDNRWCVIPPWYEKLLLLDSKFNASPATDITTGTIRNGTVGRTVMGFTLLRSNNVKNYASTNYAIMAGYDGTITFAEQVVEVEGYRPQYRTADALKGVILYDAKVIRPNAGAVLFATKA
jgi:P22 coat protein - gene protein 5